MSAEPTAGGGAVRVLIADDHAMVREGLRAFLGERSADGGAPIEVVGEAGDGEEAVRVALATGAAVALLDLRMPGVDGIEAARRLRAAGAPCRVLILTSFGDAGDGRVEEALRAGAVGYLHKDVPRDVLLRAVREAAAGAPTLDARAQAELLRALGGAGRARTPLERLSAREREVLRLVVRGESNKRIAAALGIREGTVKGYLRVAFDKLGVGDRTQAALLATRHGLQ